MTRTERADLVIVGGGPAGLCAAVEARRAGVRSVVVLDEGISPGGQIFRRFGPGFVVSDAAAAGHEFVDGERLIGQARQSGAEIRSATTVWGAWDRRLAFVSGDSRSGSIEAGAIVIATGARDRPVAVPGWTLPGVLTAGAAKTMVAIQRVLPGRRILMAGSGPLALAFAAQLLDYGANVVEVVEAAARPGIGAVARLLVHGDAATLLDAARYRARLLRRRVPYRHSTVLVRVTGSREVAGAIVATVDGNWRVVPGTERVIEVDTVLTGYGLEASAELARLMGCSLRFDRNLGGWLPETDETMRTSLPLVYAVGDGSGIGGSRLAMEEGRIAGIAAAADLGYLGKDAAGERMASARRKVGRMTRFRDALNDIYAVGPGLFELATAETIVCRCEERTQAELDALIDSGVADPNIVRAASRIGMGRCQGRNCASHVSASIARRTGLPIEAIAPLSVRPPLRPVSLAAIAEEREQPEAEIEIR